MVGYLQTSPMFSGKFTEVWRWLDFPWREGISLRDTGIDIVAQYEDGGLCAVQCKFFRLAIKVRKDDVDGFLGSSQQCMSGGAEQLEVKNSSQVFPWQHNSGIQ
jgi:predicted helicase